MQLFLDSAAEEAITYWLSQGIVDGVTTNPSVMRRDRVTDPAVAAAKLAALVAPRPVHAEATGVDGDLIAEGLSLSQLAIPVVGYLGGPASAR